MKKLLLILLCLPIIGFGQLSETVVGTTTYDLQTNGKSNEPLFYIYDDGTVEKRIVIE